MPPLLRWILGLALLYGLLVLAATRLLYHPMKFPDGWWHESGRIAASDVTLRTADGVTIHGWYSARPGSRVVTLYLHGNAGNVTNRVDKARAMLDAGSDVFLLDYRGYGKSEGRPTERGLNLDADAAFAWVKERAAGRPVVLYGESLGTAVAVALGARQRTSGLILEAAFPSVGAAARTVLPFGHWLVWGYDSASRIAQVEAPVLFLHGERDSMMPLHLGRELFQNAREPKRFVVIPGADHNDLDEVAGARYTALLREFYGERAAGAEAPGGPPKGD